MTDSLDAAVDDLVRLGAGRPQTAVVLGSGLGEVAERLVPGGLSVPYERIAGMPVGRVGGHRGELMLGEGVAVFVGRAHLYQGVAPRDVAFSVRLAAALGVRRIILTNAAGGLDNVAVPGSLVALTDHLNLTGTTPIQFDDPITPVADFVSMADAYAPHLRALMHEAAADAGVVLGEGIYAGVHGPAYETPAEAAMLRGFGASVVGMSTVVEAIAARALALDVAGISLVTNRAGTAGTHREVLEAAARGQAALGELLLHALRRLAAVDSSS